MRRALSQARLSSGRTFPNPPVGAALFRGDRLLAVGRTQPVGGPHAEVVALRAALRRHGARAVRGASLHGAQLVVVTAQAVLVESHRLALQGPDPTETHRQPLNFQ